MGNKSTKSAPHLFLKPSVLDQMLQRDTLSHSNTLAQHKLTSRFDSNGDMTARFTPPETARTERQKPAGEARKGSLRSFVERSKVVRIEVGRCKGKVGLSYLHTERSSKLSTKTSTQPSSACRSPTNLRTEPSSGCRSPVSTVLLSDTPRSLQSLSPRTLPTSMEASWSSRSPPLSPRVWKPTDPSVRDLFLEEQPHRPKGVTITRRLTRKRPKEPMRNSSISAESSEAPKRSLVSVLSEVVDIQTSEVKVQRRVGVRNIARNEDSVQDTRLLGLARLIEGKEQEEKQMYRPKKRASALRKLNTLYLLSKQGSSSRSSISRAEKQWLWTGSMGKHLQYSEQL